MFQESGGKRKTGERYEDQARKWLEAKNYCILGQNVNFRGGELDLIAEERDGKRTTLVFIEVRKRDSRGYLRPEETITFEKKRRLLRAVQLYLLSYRGRATEVRIDLIGFYDEELVHRKDFISL